MDELMKSLGNKPRRGNVYTCICGERFYRRPSWRKTRPLRNSYCSVECSYKGKIKKDGKTKLECGWCGKEYFMYKSYLKIRKSIFCSRACCGHHKSENQRGKKNPNWNNGISKLSKSIRSSSKWREWRKAVFARDNWTCQKCGARSGAGNRIEIHPDHIKSFTVIMSENKIKTFDEGMNCEELWDIENGRTLCIGCHKKTDTWGRKNRQLDH